MAMKADVPKLQKYLRKVFRNDGLKVVMPPKKSDMAEVFIGDEQIATITADEDEGDYFFTMPILGIDLDEA